MNMLNNIGELHDYYKFSYTHNQLILKKLMIIIEEYYSKERSLDFYASKMNLSIQHLCFIIKNETGKTLKDILAEFVIRDAQNRLLFTGMSIQEIAYSLNFADQSFFGRYFKRYSGVSPRTFRKLRNSRLYT